MGLVYSEVKKQDPKVLPVYRPTDLYVVVNLFGDEVRTDYLTRLQDPVLLMLLHDNAVGTMDIADSATASIPVGCQPIDSGAVVPGQDLKYFLYRLHPVRAGEDLTGRAVLCFMAGVMPELRKDNPKNWLKDHFAAVNGFLVIGSNRFCFAADGSKLNSDELLRLERERSGRLFFRVVGN